MLSPVLASCFLLLVPTSALSIAITGTNSGIGKSAASLLVAQGEAKVTGLTRALSRWQIEGMGACRVACP